MTVLFAALQAAGLAGLALAAWLGVLDSVIVDDTYITHGIIAVFAVAQVYAGVLLQQARRDLPAAPLKRRLGWVRHASSALVMLGLIGTVVGFILALGAIDPDSVGDASAIGPMVASLLAGMATALNTTLVGSVLSLWLGLSIRMISDVIASPPVRSAP